MPEYSLQRYRGKWAVVWRDEGTRHRVTTGTDDRQQAERFLARLKVEATAKDRTVGALWDAYLVDRKGRPIAETMRYTGKAIGPHFFHLDPGDITDQVCRDYTAKRRAQGRHDGSIHTELGHLRTVMVWAAKPGRRLIPEAPHIERPQKPAPKDRHLTREEAGQLIDATAEPHTRLAVITLLCTAGRVGAILGLTWDRVNFDTGKIDLRDPQHRGKGRAIVPINNTLRAALTEARQGALTDYVIEYAGKPVASISRGLRASARRAKIEGVSPHVLRHTAAVWMAEAGVPMSEIAQYLGHRDSGITERVYARYSPEHLRNAAATLELEVQLNPRTLRAV